MDISVSRLNSRMVLQVPTELPLGLVFVVGEVQNLAMPSEEVPYTHFDLVEAGHHLHCRLSPRVAEEVLLKERNSVRAGGHLVFDPHLARYYLLARDLEVLPGLTPGRTKMAPILEDVKKRADAAALVRTELPHWVKMLAPPEIQAELGLLAEEAAVDTPAGSETPDSTDEAMDLLAPVGDLPDDMLAFLAEAMESSDDVELTPEVLSHFLPLEPQREPPAGTEVIEPEPVAEAVTQPVVPVPVTPTVQTARAAAHGQETPPVPAAAARLQPTPPARPAPAGRTGLQVALLVSIVIVTICLIIVIVLLANLF